MIEILERIVKEHGWNSVTDCLDNSMYQRRIEFIEQACKEYNRLMCDKQKEICAKQALVKQEYTNHNDEIITNAMQIYNIEKYDSYYYDVEIYPDHSSILNAPYPDELQGNN